jgi:hypothetical protein
MRVTHLFSSTNSETDTAHVMQHKKKVDKCYNKMGNSCNYVIFINETKTKATSLKHFRNTSRGYLT